AGGEFPEEVDQLQVQLADLVDRHGLVGTQGAQVDLGNSRVFHLVGFGGAFGCHEFGQGVLGQRLQAEGERVEVTAEREVFALQRERSAYQEQQVLDGEQVPHLLLGDVRDGGLPTGASTLLAEEKIELVVGQTAGLPAIPLAQGEGGVEVLDQQGVLD